MQPHNPIEHVVIIVKENHSFDNYFGWFPGANGASLPAAQDPPAGGDPPHDHAAWLQRANHAVKLQYSEKDIPAYTSAIFITWDDWGGWYDYVDPPLKDKWTGGGPDQVTTTRNSAMELASAAWSSVLMRSEESSTYFIRT